MIKQPLVYIVVLNYMNYNDTIECVNSLELINYRNCKIIIVDNCSSNESYNIFKKTFTTHCLIQSSSNAGYAAGNNIGIKIALEQKAEYVLIINNDTVASPDFLSILVDYAEEDRSAGLISPLILRLDGAVDRTCARRLPSYTDYFWRIGVGRLVSPSNSTVKKHVYDGEYDFKVNTEVEVISGSCMLLRSKLIEEIGLLDENTFLYLEEFILAEKIAKTNYKTVLVPQSKIIHKHGKSVGSIKINSLRINIDSLRYYLKSYKNYNCVLTNLALTSVCSYFFIGYLKSKIIDITKPVRQ